MIPTFLLPSLSTTADNPEPLLPQYEDRSRHASITSTSTASSSSSSWRSTFTSGCGSRPTSSHDGVSHVSHDEHSWHFGFGGSTRDDGHGQGYGQEQGQGQGQGQGDAVVGDETQQQSLNWGDVLRLVDGAWKGIRRRIEDLADG